MDNRRLDTAIAEKVMKLITGPIVEIIGGKAVNAAGDSVILPAYSEDISFAWEVVEKMQEKGYFEMSSWPNDYHASFTTQDGYGYSGQASTAPLAICLAALKCVGVEAAP